jgi:hypothetical protein
MHKSDSKTHPPISLPVSPRFRLTLTHQLTAYTDWHLELDLPGAYFAGIIKRVFLSLPEYFSRRPDSSFILSATNEPKDGKNALDHLIQGLKADSWAMVHLPHGGTVTVDLARAFSPSEGRFRSWWLDPRTGAKTVRESGYRADITGEASFTSPSEGSIEQDWVLLLETFTP